MQYRLYSSSRRSADSFWLHVGVVVLLSLGLWPVVAFGLWGVGLASVWKSLLVAVVWYLLVRVLGWAFPKVVSVVVFWLLVVAAVCAGVLRLLLM